jgi:hypothetical protein
MALLAVPGASIGISAIAGIAGYAAEDILMKMGGNTGSGVFGAIGSVFSGATSVITTVYGFFTGDWVWWIGSAGAGIVAGILGNTATGGAIFPMVASFGAGFALRLVKDRVISEM